MPKRVYLDNQRFGMLTVISEACNLRTKRSQVYCVCDCGVKKTIDKCAVKDGLTKSCGCLAIKISKLNGRLRGRKDPYVDINIVYQKYKIEAGKRSHIFELTKEQFREIVRLNCYMCGMEPSQQWDIQSRDWRTRLYRKGFKHNGIDRFDNSKGYTFENSRPCCKNCNYLKRQLSYEQAIEHAKKIVTFQNSN